MHKKIFISDLAAALLLMLWLYTAINKFMDLPQFHFALMRSPLLAKFSKLLTWFIPSLEILLAILLFIPATRKKGLVGSFILLLLFTIYLIYMLAFTADRPCSCGGVINSLTWPEHIVFNVFFLVVSFTAH